MQAFLQILKYKTFFSNFENTLDTSTKRDMAERQQWEIDMKCEDIGSMVQ